MQDLECYDAEQLEAELRRRREEKEKSERPRPLQNPDWDRLIAQCEDYMDFLYHHSYEEKDSDHYLYEAVLSTVYGRTVWIWINKRLD